MSINASWLRIFLEMRKRYDFNGHVVVWGVQDVDMTHAEAADVIRERGYSCTDIPESSRKYMLSKSQQQWSSDPHHFMDTKDLFYMLRFTRALTLDAFAHENPDILCDLNQPLPDKYKRKFDLLIDIGVIEHTSNGFQALENAANLLRPGGHLVCFTPLFFPIQTAIFHPNPPFYYDILSANGFGNFTSYINWIPDWDQHTDIRTIWLSYQYDDAVEVFREHYYTGFFVVAKKLEHVEKFRTVLQKYYVKWHNESGIPQPGNLPASELSNIAVGPSEPTLNACQGELSAPESTVPEHCVVPQYRIEVSPGTWAPYAPRSIIPEPRHGLQSIPERMFAGNPPREQLYL
jgi:SAM-dependent methyltransferase